MDVTAYLFFYVFIAFAYVANSNEENDLGPNQPGSKLSFLEPNDQNDSDFRNKEEIVEGTVPQERAPYFTNMKKMLKIHVKPAGNMISLKCKAGGYPTPNVTWYKNNEVPTRHLGNIRYGQWSLTLEDLITDDSGTYRCVVCNVLGCINFNYTVDVVERYHNRPILINPPQNKTVVVGSNVTFSCTFVSDLQSHIFWTKGISGETATVETITTRQNPEILELLNVTHDSEGWYTCVAANTLGVTSSSAYLKVVDENQHLQSMEYRGKGYRVSNNVGVYLFVDCIILWIHKNF